MPCPYHQLWRRSRRLEVNSVFSCPAPGDRLLARKLRQGASFSQTVAMKKASKASLLPIAASGRCALEKD